jgi:glutathione S-transferase
MTNVEIFGFPPSTYTQSALLIAAEKGADTTLTPVAFGEPSHRAVHPFARMPAMRHGDVQLYETAAIGVYLDEAFGGPSLQPATATARANMWQWISSAVDYFYPVLVSATLRHGEGDPPLDQTERIRALDVLETGLAKSDFLVGDSVTLADFVVGPMLRFQIGAAKDEDLLADRPNLKAWLERLTARQSFSTLAAG